MNLAARTMFAILVTLIAASTAQAADPPLSRIAFGSCATQERPQPIWDAVGATKPELLLLLGDNIYADTEDMAVMRAKYARFAAMPGFKKLRESVPILATWDDHDLGVNDGGSTYPKKDESQKEFFDFFGEPADSPRRKQQGVYDAKVFGPEGKRVQVIMLDTRYFRTSPPQAQVRASRPRRPLRRESRSGRHDPRRRAVEMARRPAQSPRRDPSGRLQHPGRRRGPRVREVDEFSSRT